PREMVEACERLIQRLEHWDKCGEEEQKRRLEEMRRGARRCDYDHRHAVCNCACCDWVLLGRLLCCPERKEGDAKREYLADLTVRRFIRPVLSYDYMAYGVKE